MCKRNFIKESNLSHEYLTSILNYDPETGIFTWKVNRQGISVGVKAGWVNSHGHINIGIDGTQYRAHRLAYFYVCKTWPNIVDHENRCRADNRIANLRNVNQSENSKNCKAHKNNKSGQVGVNFSIRANKWKAQIVHNRLQHHLGYFDKLEDAIKVRKQAEQAYGFHPTHGNVLPLASLVANF